MHVYNTVYMAKGAQGAQLALWPVTDVQKCTGTHQAESYKGQILVDFVQPKTYSIQNLEALPMLQFEAQSDMNWVSYVVFYKIFGHIV